VSFQVKPTTNRSRSALADAGDEDVPAREHKAESDSDLAQGIPSRRRPVSLEQPVAFDSDGCFCVGGSVRVEHLAGNKLRGLFLEPPPPQRKKREGGPVSTILSRTGDDWYRFPSTPVQDSRHANRCLMRRLGPEPPRHQ
jgi:hypothetical protein